MDTKTLDNNTLASNQGSHPITRAEFARYYGHNFLDRQMLYLNSFLPVIRGSLRMLWGGFRWQRTKEWFLYGDITPAMVLDPEQNLVAAYTDLAQDPQYRFPVVKVFSEKLHFIKAGVSRGQKYAAVALYTSDSNSALCAATNAKISDSDWTALEIGLAQIADQSKAGIYDITLPKRVQG